MTIIDYSMCDSKHCLSNPNGYTITIIRPIIGVVTQSNSVLLGLRDNRIPTSGFILAKISGDFLIGFLNSLFDITKIPKWRKCIY